MENLEALLNAAASIDTEKAEAVVKQAKSKTKKNQTSKVEATSAPAAETTATVAPETKTIDGDLKSMSADVSNELVAQTKQTIIDQFEARLKFEADNGGTERKTKLLESYQSKLTNEAVVRALVAIRFDTSFVNRQTGAKRFNVYAVDKVCDIAAALAGVGVRNKVNNAIMRSLFACRKEGLEFTGLLADAAVSDKVRVAEHIKKVLVRHSVSESTVDTQRSSTISALTLFGIVENVGTHKEPVFRLTDTPQTRALEQLMAA